MPKNLRQSGGRHEGNKKPHKQAKGPQNPTQLDSIHEHAEGNVIEEQRGLPQAAERTDHLAGQEVLRRSHIPFDYKTVVQKQLKGEPEIFRQRKEKEKRAKPIQTASLIVQVCASEL